MKKINHNYAVILAGRVGSRFWPLSRSLAQNIIFEPEGKNTAPSIAVAGCLIALSDSQAKMAVFPSDHLIKNQRGFHKLMRSAFSLTGVEKHLFVFGIPLAYPATGYGYIKIKLPPHNVTTSPVRIYQVEKFTEKPDAKTVKRFYQDKRYFWNSGMFFGYARVFLNEIKEKLPSLYKLVSGISKPER